MNNSRPSVSIEEFSSTLTYIELVLIGTIMISINVATVIGNALVMIAFVVDKKLRTLTNYFILSLAVSDFMIATFSMPLFTLYLLTGEWTLGPIICDMWLSQDYTCGNASFLNLLMIAIDRYYSVTDPLRYRAKRTGKRVAIMISCVWIIAFLIWPPWIYGWPYIEGRRTVPEDDCYIQFLETNTYVTIITAVFDYYVPVAIILVLYYKIWRATKKRGKYLANMESGYKSESKCLQKQNSANGKVDRKQTSMSLPSSNGKYINGQNGSKPDEKIYDAGSSLLEEVVDSKAASEIIGDNDQQHEIALIAVNLNNVRDNDSTDEFVESKIPVVHKDSIKNDNKAARVLTAILLTFILTTTPYNVVVIVKNLDTFLVPDALWNFFYYLFYVNSTFNPLCYALANENFRTTYWKILTCSWNKKPGEKYDMNNYSNKYSGSKNSHTAKQVTSSV